MSDLLLVTSATRIFASLFYGFRLADVAKGKCHLAKRSPTRKGKLFTWVKSFRVAKVQYTVGEAVKYIELSTAPPL